MAFETFPFIPAPHATVNATITTTASSVSAPSGLQAGQTGIIVYNAGPDDVYVEGGYPPATAASPTDSMPIPAGQRQVFSYSDGYVLSFVSKGTSAVSVSYGRGNLYGLSVDSASAPAV